MDTNPQGAGVQLSFRDQGPFTPMRLGSGHYLAALQNMSGEMDALSHASDGTWVRLTPLVQFVGR